MILLVIRMLKRTCYRASYIHIKQKYLCFRYMLKNKYIISLSSCQVLCLSICTCWFWDKGRVFVVYSCSWMLKRIVGTDA